MRILFALCMAAFSAIASPIDTASPPSDASREEALFLRRIADFWEEGEVQIAKSQMESFLKQFAASPYADTLRLTLGDLLLREKNFSDALQYYAQITSAKLEPKVFLRRMECLYHLGWHATLADECELYLQEGSSQEEADRLEAMHLLVIALYEQCLTGSKEESVLQALAERAKPYVGTLMQSELTSEVASALAHLHVVCKNFPSAAQMYLDLAEKEDNAEEFIFQAALIQSKYDKALALQTFQHIADRGEKFHAEATYNKLLLSFDLKRDEEIVAQKETWAKLVHPSKQALAHLLVGQSLLRLGRLSDATAEFDAFLTLDLPIESLRAACPHFLNAAMRTKSLALLDHVIEKWQETDAQDPHLADVFLARAELLKKCDKFEEAKAEIGTLLTRFPAFAERAEASFALVQLEADSANFAACREAALSFLQQYPSHELAPSAWRHALRASSELSAASKELKAQFAQDLQQCLAHGDLLSVSERGDLQFRLAKVQYEMGRIDEALVILTPLCETESGILFSEQPNAELLLALCYRESQTNHALFCHWAEAALAHDATLMSKAEQHLALFNSYLVHEPMAEDRLAHHLTESLSLESAVGLSNLLWLANYASEHRFNTKEVLARILARKDVNPQHLTDETLPFESVIVQYAKLLQEPKEAATWLELLDAQYRTSPDLQWRCVAETRLALAESLLASGSVQLAEALFDDLASSTILRDRFAATAALQSARIKQASPDPDTAQILTLLKNISLQKALVNEPVHLEAALDYIELAAGSQTEKSLDLLLKTKADFEAKDDLLSLDYHAAREKNGSQNQIYLDYMRYFDAKILLTKAKLEQDAERQKELQANAKELLLQITGDIAPDLQRRLAQFDGV